MSLLTELNLFKKQIKLLGALLSEENAALIVPILKEKSFKKGQIVLKTGEICTEAYFITKGLMRSFHQMSNGSQKTYVISSEHELFTEQCSFLSQKPSTDYLEAIEDTNVLYFSYDDLEKLYQKSHVWESVGRKISDKSFVVAKSRLRSLMNDDAQIRYLKFLKTYRNLLTRIPQHIIASYVGITPQSLSRLKRELENVTTE